MYIVLLREDKVEGEATWYNTPSWGNLIRKELGYGTHCHVDHTVLNANSRVYPQMDELYLPLPSQPELVLIHWPQGMKGLVWLGTILVSKQSAQDVTWQTWQLLAVQAIMPNS